MLRCSLISQQIFITLGLGTVVNTMVVVYSVMCLTLATPWTIDCQASLTMGFSRQEYWSGLPFPFLGDFPNPGTEPRSPALQVDSLPTELWGRSCEGRYKGEYNGYLSCPQAAYSLGKIGKNPASKHLGLFHRSAVGEMASPWRRERSKQWWPPSQSCGWSSCED